MGDKTTVLFCGAATRDTILLVPKLPTDERGGKIVALDCRECAAGMATSAAVAAARCGAAATICASVGNDGAGAAYLADLAKEGLDTSWVRVVHESPTAVSTILVDPRGERLVIPYCKLLAHCTSPAQLVVSAYVCSSLTPGLHDLIHEDAAKLSSIDGDWPPRIGIGKYNALLTDTRSPAAAHELLLAARQAAVPSVLDGDVTPDLTTLERLAKAADHVLFSRPGLVSLLPADVAKSLCGSFNTCAWSWALRSLQKRLPTAAVVGVTLGEDGVVWINTTEPLVSWHLRPPVVHVKDTLSAGDVFHGVYTFKIAQGDTILKAVAAGCAAAALKCQTFGGRLGSPNADELSAFMATWDWASSSTQCCVCPAQSDCSFCDKGPD